MKIRKLGYMLTARQTYRETW